MQVMLGAGSFFRATLLVHKRSVLWDDFRGKREIVEHAQHVIYTSLRRIEGYLACVVRKVDGNIYHARCLFVVALD